MGTALYIGDGRDDVKRRLVGSICRYKGDPVYVASSAGTIISIFKLGDGAKFKIDHTDPEFDYRSPPLGYANFNGRAYYLTRIPTRDNAKAGIAPENVILESGDRLPFGWESSYMGKCIKGEYPSFQEALIMVDQGADSVACSRHFAVSRFGRSSLALHHRDRAVGIREGSHFKLMEGQDRSVLERLARKAGVPL